MRFSTKRWHKWDWRWNQKTVIWKDRLLSGGLEWKTDMNHNTSYTQVILYKLGAKINVFFEKVAIVWRKVEKKVTFRHAISAFGQISLIFDTDFGNYLYLCPHACKVYSYCVFCVTSCYVTHEYFESSRRRLLKLSKCFWRNFFG